jgi:nucleoside triphosphate pyrophosphatase
VVVPEVEELTEGEPEATVVENARRKARAGTEILMRGHEPPKLAGAVTGVAGGEWDLVLGVDTEVVLDGRLLGKAADQNEARDRLEALSGRTHEVLSGVVVLARDASSLDFVGHRSTKSRVGAEVLPSVPGDEVAERSGLAKSRVTFRDLTPELLAAYLASGEWRDRAGAYAVQGLGSTLVERVEGDLSNVIGLPVALLAELVPDLLAPAGDSRY